MAKTDSPTSLQPASEISRAGKHIVLFAEDTDAFRAACASDAVQQAAILLDLLKREFDPAKQSDYGFCVIFETTMRRVRDLLDSVNIGPGRDEVIEDQDIADVVFGEEWLIGTRLEDGRVVPASKEEEARHV